MFIHNLLCMLCDSITTKKRVHWCELKFHYILYYHSLFVGNPVNSKLLVKIITDLDNPYRVQRNRYFKLKPILEDNGYIECEQKNLRDGRTVNFTFTENGLEELQEIIQKYQAFINKNGLENFLMSYKAEIYQFVKNKVTIFTSENS
ncbi:hypothetical protein LCGC14_0175860 [marine sediment metagenome]|uniref:Uncharacterized protein n=1 Tax=marine sediment metagenome TaxID=412755 RepID=A0A0F9V7M3_9ZZZZ